MKDWILRFEPIIWFFFGGGFFIGCLLFPALIFTLGIALPLGFAPAEALSYERLYGLASSLPSRLLLLVMVVFPLWNGLNHLRHFAIDLGGAKRDVWIAPLCYGAAAVLSVVAIVAVVRL